MIVKFKVMSTKEVDRSQLDSLKTFIFALTLTLLILASGLEMSKTAREKLSGQMDQHTKVSGLIINLMVTELL